MSKTEKTQIPFVDLSRAHRPLREKFLGVLARAIDESAFVMGSAVREFEEAFAQYCGSKYCVGVSSGTDALVLALKAAGLGRGDEVITVPNSFIATAAAIRMAGATPVFVDVDERTQLMDVRLLERAITPRTRAILPVHLFGQVAQMSEIHKVASAHKLIVIEDACQAHGATLGGRRIGELGSLAATFSFYAGKNLGALGEAGAVITNDSEFASRLRRLREHGQSEKYIHAELGTNARLDAIQAGFLSVKLAHLDSWNAERRRLAARYNQKLSGVPGVLLPHAADPGHVYHLYVVRVKDRDGARRFLQERGISTGIHYPIPIHLQGAFADAGYGPGSFPVTEMLAREIISLPMFPGLTDAEVDRVCGALTEWCEKAV